MHLAGSIYSLCSPIKNIHKEDEENYPGLISGHICLQCILFEFVILTTCNKIIQHVSHYASE